MKPVARLSIVAAALALTGPVFAQTLASSLSTSKNVTVAAALTSACLFDSSTDLALNVSYPAFSDTDKATSGEVAMTCTRLKAPTSISFANTDIGVAGGLAFKLTVSPWTETQTGADPQGGSISDLGTPLKGKFTVTATFPAGQAGTNGVTASATKAMTITF